MSTPAGAKPDNRTADEFYDDMERLMADLRMMLADKRRAYGTTNLIRFGPMGILIRMGDKMDRLINRFRDGTDAVGGMDADTVEDSWRDLCGYALLGLMEHRRQKE